MECVDCLSEAATCEEASVVANDTRVKKKLPLGLQRHAPIALGSIALKSEPHLRYLGADDAEALGLTSDELVVTDNIHFLTTPFTLADAQKLVEGGSDGCD